MESFIQSNFSVTAYVASYCRHNVYSILCKGNNWFCLLSFTVLGGTRSVYHYMYGLIFEWCNCGYSIVLSNWGIK